MNNIECEIRAEVKVDEFDSLLDQLKTKGKYLNRTDRLSVMFFRCSDSGDYDLRVRVTNGEYEVVLKRGDHHAADRVETEQKITQDQFIGMVRVFRQFNWDSAKVGERETYNLDFGDGVLVSLVRAGDIAYLEIEKMANEEKLKQTQAELEALANELGVQIIQTREEYYALCQRYTDETDWMLEGVEPDYQRLAEQLKKSAAV